MAEAKKKVYVETSVVSNLTARRSSRVADALMQITTEAWWEMASIRYSLFYSSVVVDEASRGNPEAAQRRLEALKGLVAIEYDERAVDLANRLLRSTAVPKNSFNDAMHTQSPQVLSRLPIAVEQLPDFHDWPRPQQPKNKTKNT